MPALRPAGETDTVSVDGAVPEASDTLSHVALAVEVQESVPVPALAICIDCDAGSAPPAVYANCKLDGVTPMEDAPATIIPKLSVPVDAATCSVCIPDRPAGIFTEIDVLCHDVTVRDCAVEDPAGVSETLQPLHCEPKLAPVMVIVVPAVTARPVALVDSGLMEKIAAPNLQRTALAYPTGAFTVPQVMVPNELLAAE